jgi:hypothetical protein
MEFKLDHAKEILGRTPATLNSLLRQLPDNWAFAKENPEDGWSAFDVVGHLIHAEETDWIPRARMILEHGEARAFEPFDRFAMFEKFKDKSMSELLDMFEQSRRQSLQELDAMNLTPETLGKQGLHPELGTVTLSQLLSTWVVHDLSHISQIVRIMAKQYGEAVGAWKEYLSILTR